MSKKLLNDYEILVITHRGYRLEKVKASSIHLAFQRASENASVNYDIVLGMVNQSDYSTFLKKIVQL